jgi:hypothetical protein
MTSTWLFAPYETASLDGLRRDSELQYAPRSELEPMLARIAEVEGPVHVDVAIDRIREHYGMSRARQASRDQVKRVVEGMRRADKLRLVIEPASSRQASATELFLSTPSTVVYARRPNADVEQRRAISQISFAEIELGLTLVVRATYGGRRDELLRETARQFGYDRTGPDIAARIGDCLDRMVESGSLVESFGMYTAAGGHREA